LRGPTAFAPGDTLIYTWTGVAARATGFVTTVTVSASNGTWTGLPATLNAGPSPVTYTFSAIPWDSATFNFSVWGSNSAGLSLTPWTQTVKVKRRPGTPTGTLDTSKAVGTLVLPNPTTLALGATRAVCAFKQFANGAVATWTADKASCDSIAMAYVPAAARALVTPGLQAHTDSLTVTCVTWTSSLPAAVGVLPRVPCASAAMITGLGVTLAPADVTRFRYADTRRAAVRLVDRRGRATCIRPGVGYVWAIADNGVRSGAKIVCGMLPAFLAAR
jgi:hypothetical protein